MSKKTTFTVLKSKIADEADALQDVCTKKNVQPEQLEANHTEKTFRWTLIVADDNETETDWKAYPKDEFEEQEAIAQAITDFESFEGNLKTDHTETEYRFAKIRG